MNDPVERLAARVLLQDGEGRLLLFRAHDPDRPEAGDWWFTPGGGVEPGETLPQAARREVLEETGQVLPLDLGPVVLTRTTRFSFEGVEYAQTDHFFRVTAADTRVEYTGWTATENRAVRTHRWWTLDELRTTSERIHPDDLVLFLG